MKSLGPVTTKDKILDTAELLFSDLGFDNTSLRSITSKADVNLASVNYHFGSKKELIQAVMERYLSVLMPAIDDKLTQLTSGDKPANLTTLFEAMVEPILKLDSVRPNGARTFMQLFAKAYYESQGHMKRFVNERYGAVLRRFNAALVTTVPHLPMREVFWRWHFALGSCVFTMGSSKALTDMAEADYKQRMAVAELIRGVIHFIAAGFAAPSVETVTEQSQVEASEEKVELCPERDIA